VALRPKNWEKFQHYKDRRPPWIKLHHDLIDSKEFFALPGVDAKFLILIWLLASEENGLLPPVDEIAFRLRISEDKTNELLSRLQAWFVDDASEPLADCKQVDTPETETETETETGRRTFPEWWPHDAWQDFLIMRNRERHPLTRRAIELCIAKLTKLRDEGQDVRQVLEQSVMNSYRGLFPVNGDRKAKPAKAEYPAGFFDDQVSGVKHGK